MQKARDILNELEKWQMAVLALLALAVVGVYLLLVNMVGSRIHTQPIDRSVDLTAPADGTVVQVGSSITVEAEASGADLNRLEVWADDAPLFVSSRSMPAGDDPWTVSGQWVVGWPGTHRLFVRGFTAGGEMIVSGSITIPAAPEGRLLFSSKRDGHYAIYRSRLDGGELERLFIGEGDSREPSVQSRWPAAADPDSGRPAPGIVAGRSGDPLGRRAVGRFGESVAGCLGARWRHAGLCVESKRERSGVDQRASTPAQERC